MTRDATYDIAIYMGVGVLGPLDEAVAALRRVVRPGGYLLIEDVYLNGAETIRRPGYETCLSYEDSTSQLTSHGDVILREIIDQGTAAGFEHENRLIRRRADQISAAHPELADLLSAYVQGQVEECEVLQNQCVCAIWLLQTTSGAVTDAA